MSNSICLNMIVRNESKIIRRLFDSVLPIIDTYCICDTGSKDNTIEIIKKYFTDKKISGKVFEHPFKNFGYNRSYSFKEAQKMGATYILLLDADMVLLINKDFDKQKLTKQAYTVGQGSLGLIYYNPRLIRSDVKVTVKGPTHEYYDFSSNISKQKLETLFINDINDGGHKENKFTRDIRLLLEGIEEEPNNDRYHFYLANSYHDTQQYEKASEMYKKRIALGGWYEEVWYSYFRLGLCYKYMNKMDSAIFTWLDGYNYYPKRVEALYEIVKYYRENKKYLLAYHFYKIANSIPFPKDDILFVHTNVYEYLLDYEYLLIHYYIPDSNTNESIQTITMRLMNILPCGIFYNLLSNLKYYIKPLTSRKQMKISFSSSKKINNKEYNSSNIAIVPYQEGYMLNIQFKPNKKDNNSKLYKCAHDTLYLDDDFLTIEQEPVRHSRNTQNTYNLNDVSLSLLGDNIYYSANTYLMNDQLDNEVVSTPVFGLYNITDSSNLFDIQSRMEVKNVIMDSPPHDINHYALFEDDKKIHFVYSWYPILIGTIENQETSSPDYIYDSKESNYIMKKGYNKLKHIHVNIQKEKRECPSIFKLLEHTTNGYSYESEIWFVADFMTVHGAHSHSQQKMKTYHFFIILDRKTKQLARYSYPFTFENKEFEKCSGLIVEKKQIILTYSILDKGCFVATYDIKSIRNSIVWRDWA